jgi:hypothetical protein
VDRLNTSLGVSLPSQYQTTVKNFVKNSKILSDQDAQTFTEQFIKDQMKTSWHQQAKPAAVRLGCCLWANPQQQATLHRRGRQPGTLGRIRKSDRESRGLRKEI